MGLSVVNVAKKFENVIFKNVSFTIERGESLTILGFSGSGKSTLLRIICGLEKPSEGEVYLDNKSIEEQVGKVVLVFQNYALWPHLTVLENVLLPLKYKGFTKDQAIKKAKSSLALLQISQLADKYPNQISGGQQQRVALARALAFEPDFVLLDEPFANLDPALRRNAVVDIKKYFEMLKIGSILVTHNVDDAAEFSKSMAVLHSGTFYGPSSFNDFYFKPPNLEVASIFGNISYVRTESGTIVTRPELIQILNGKNFEIIDVSVRRNLYIVKAVRDNVITTVEIPADNAPELKKGDRVDLKVESHNILFKLV